MQRSITALGGLFALTIFQFSCPAADPRPNVGSYTKQLFRLGLDENVVITDSPHYVLVRVADASEECLVCLAASSLQYAIHVERKIPFTSSGVKKVKHFAASNWNRQFRFTKSAAIASVKRVYTAADLSEARGDVRKAIGKGSLGAKQAGMLEASVARLIEKNAKPEVIARRRDSLAHAVLERGILAQYDHLTGGLFIQLRTSEP